ncbi:MAG: GNAT family N-acetyltransferase [Christensenellales bacterium]|jgi:predicted GNAT family N-acyltransferase
MITSVFIPGNKDLSEPYMIRREVFIKEQHCPENEEFDSFDAQAIHLMVYVDEVPAATGRIWYDGSDFRIGRLAVRKPFRGQKIGDLALRLLIYKAFSSGAESLNISAQTYIIPLYKKFGFKEYGQEYLEAGIPHMAMKVAKDAVVYPSACGNKE